ncbi:class I SAM-dependent methyltransferase [Neorhodopirellula pilleata]|nr:class I SAM-dependent methyltransferase [Neorhodopirellula pilleata]
MLRCSECSFVWNADFDSDRIVYDGNYNNDVSTSRYYVEHLEAMAERIVRSIPSDRPIYYVEVGCGEADFLNLVVRKSGGRCLSAIGFDPSFTGEETLLPGVTVHKSFFGAEQLGLVPKNTNVICSRHTIEHVPDVRGFVSAVAAAMDSPERRLFFETPDANWILRNVAFQDFFYEHCSLFTPHSVLRLLSDHGLEGQVDSVYDGQYMWIEAMRSSQDRPNIESCELPAKLADEYRTKQAALISHWASYVRDRRERGRVAIWGGASKGVTFAILLMQQLHCSLECAIDLNPAKQGRFLPSTALPVLAPDEAMRCGVQTVVIMNPNYENEIRALAQQMDWHPEFATLNSVVPGNNE